MGQLLAVVLLVSMLVPEEAEGSRTRILALGGAEKVFTIEDPLNIWRLPSTLVHYASLAGIETAGDGHTSFGIHLRVGDGSVIGVYGSSTSHPALSPTRAGSLGSFTESEELRMYRKKNPGDYTPVDAGAGVNDGHGVTAKGTVFFATTLGNWGRLGIRAGVWADSVREQLASPQAEIITEKGPLVIDTALGLGADVLGGQLDLSLGFEYGTYDHTASTAVQQAGSGTAASPTETKDISSGHEYRFSALICGRYAIAEWATVIPYVDGFYQSSEGIPGNMGADELQFFSYGVAGGLDVAFRVTDWLTIQPGVGVGYQQSTDELVDVDRFQKTVLQLPSASLAIDAHVLEWLDVRLGAGLVASEHSGTQSDDDTEGWATRYRVGGGFGFKLPAGVALDIQAQYGDWLTGPLVHTPSQVDGFGANIGLHARW